MFMRHVRLEKGEVIASYVAAHQELDPAPLTDLLRLRGHKIALPVVVGKAAPLVFRLHEPKDLLIPNAFGILEPSLAAQAIEPDLLLVPLLAFDKARQRLGYGGGYYDRTIAELRQRKTLRVIGIAYSFQEVDEVPVGPNDIPLDLIVTERDVFLN